MVEVLPVYDQIIATIFKQKYRKGATEVPFAREDIVHVATRLKVNVPKNLGDVLYAYRFRRPMPESVRKLAPSDKHWTIKLIGRGQYKFCLVTLARIAPSPSMVVTKLPDSTPEIVASHTLNDEQALLARVRYNRLVDLFLGVTAYSLQNHLRTTVKGVGQVEIDELYAALDRHGAEYIIPVQAKGGSDEVGSVQAEQDLAFCDEKYPDLVPRLVAAQFARDGVIAMFELTMQDGEIRLVREHHYQLVDAADVTDEDRQLYRMAANNARE